MNVDELILQTISENIQMTSKDLVDELTGHAKQKIIVHLKSLHTHKQIELVPNYKRINKYKGTYRFVYRIRTKQDVI